MPPPKTTTLATATAARIDSLLTVYAEAAMRDAAVTQAAERAMELLTVDEGMALAMLPPDELRARGWTRAELIVAIDAKKSRRETPGYLSFAYDRQVATRRALPSGNGGGEGALGFVIPTSEAAPLEIEGTEEDDEP